MEMIKTAFCFDANLTALVQATAASLVDQCVKDSVHCEIHCVCTSAAASVEEPLRRIVEARDPASLLYMHCIDNPYADSYEVRDISVATYLRLALHKLLPEIDKILYMDVDVLVLDSLLPLWETPLTDHVLAAVRGTVNLSDKWEWNSDRPYWHLLAAQKGNYINAGITLLNLSEIPRRGLDVQWNELAKEKLYYQDQDILNITCQGVMVYLPPKYNRLTYMEDLEYHRLVEEGIYTQEEYEEALEKPAILHYAGDKPWNRYNANLGEVWWDYVNSQPDLQGLFDENKARRNHGPTLADRAVRKVKKILSKEKL